MTKARLIVVILLCLVLIPLLSISLRPIIFQNRAASSLRASDVSANSYLFASPLQAKAGGKEAVRVYVFLLDSTGMGIPGIDVNLSYPPALNLASSQATTDNSGTAYFDLVSQQPGKHELSASYSGNISLPGSLKVFFY